MLPVFCSPYLHFTFYAIPNYNAALFKVTNSHSVPTAPIGYVLSPPAFSSHCSTCLLLFRNFNTRLPHKRRTCPYMDYNSVPLPPIISKSDAVSSLLAPFDLCKILQLPHYFAGRSSTSTGARRPAPGDTRATYPSRSIHAATRCAF
jgi:hypothetical protein